MKKLIGCLFILFLPAISSVSGQKQSLKVVAPIKAGIRFEQKEVRLGKIKKGKTYGAVFRFVNNMTRPLVIFSVKTSCGCTVARWEKKPLASKAASQINVEFKADERGHFAKSIKVSSNSDGGEVELKIKGVVL